VYIGTSTSDLAILDSSNVEYHPDTQIVVTGASLNITITESWTAEETYQFNIATEEGITVLFQGKAPSMAT
jgi:hypothetical protein